MAVYKVVCTNYAETFESLTNGVGKKKNNTILMGSFVKTSNQTNGGWEYVEAFGIAGWIESTSLGTSPGLKIFYIDVGQGDAALIEVGEHETGKGLKIIIDGGPDDNLSRYLNKWQFKYYHDKHEKVHIDYLFISHFDKDHYNGFIDLINDERYTFGSILHNGICKFKAGAYGTTLGNKQGKYLVTSFDDEASLAALHLGGGMQDLMARFAKAIQNAFRQGRITTMKRLDHHAGTIIQNRINQHLFQIDVLGPVTDVLSGVTAFKYFKDDAHTVNGHSLVLKITYGQKSFLFGGDLNIPAEDHLLKYHESKVFEVDVAKSCHHGASEFTLEFMKSVNPLATVISSGDNESYSHPRADAIGCAGKYSRSDRPLVFSTELARSNNLRTDEVKYGMINLRCDGETILMAQMKEAGKAGNIWDIYHPA